MRYCTDTWFFHRLHKEDARALNIYRHCRTGKDQLIVPAVVLTEYRAWCIRRGLPKVAGRAYENLQRMDHAFLTPLTADIAWLAGELRGSFNTPTVDALIGATAIAHKCHALLSGDGHFEVLHKAGRVKLENW